VKFSLTGAADLAIIQGASTNNYRKMKTIKLDIMGGSGLVQRGARAPKAVMKPLSSEEEARLAANVAKLRASLGAEVAETRAELEQWLDRIPETRSASTMIALLEAALNRYIDLHGEPDAFELIELAFRKFAKKTRPMLQ
jgi:hypothetical protein